MKLLVTLALTLILNGCATMVVVVGCAGSSRQSTCDALGEVAWELDGMLLDAVTPDPKYAPLEHVFVQGVVTSGGVPLHEAKAELLLGDELWGTVRTDTTGRYQIRDVLESSKCHKLRVILRHPDQRSTAFLSVRCGEQ